MADETEVTVTIPETPSAEPESTVVVVPDAGNDELVTRVTRLEDALSLLATTQEVLAEDTETAVVMAEAASEQASAATEVAVEAAVVAAETPEAESVPEPTPEPEPVAEPEPDEPPKRTHWLKRPRSEWRDVIHERKNRP